ncbi:hypothetical protein [Gottfriedia solisilvae]|uniref:hypothetical protein n=1 Tax=Gottfriedia solisilvae TaxID=1516104 RepID=UPI003D2F3856
MIFSEQEYRITFEFDEFVVSTTVYYQNETELTSDEIIDAGIYMLNHRLTLDLEEFKHLAEIEIIQKQI